MSSPSIVLYAEDSEDDAFFMRHAFEESRFPGQLVILDNGRDATRYLAGDGEFADRDRFPAPCLVLLDVKMPHMTGLDALDWIRTKEAFRQIPVIILTSSNVERDVRRAYASGADRYVVKPAGVLAYKVLVRALAEAMATGGSYREAPLPGALSVGSHTNLQAVK